MNEKVEIKPNKNFNSLAVEAKGHENLLCFDKDCRNYIQTVRSLKLKNMIQHYFLKMQSDNSNFFYIIDLYYDGWIKNVFWAIAISKATYKEFNDAVTFDTTYLNIDITCFLHLSSELIIMSNHYYLYVD